VITLVDYGAGNVRSVAKALEAVGARVRLTSTATDVRRASKIVLPGVGAFGDCITSLRRRGLVLPIQQAIADGIPFLGICVGMQVLFAEGEELGLHEGIGAFPGRVVRLPSRLVAQGFKIPHTGWNQIRLHRTSPLFRDLPAGAWVYFNHAYFCAADGRDVLASCNHGIGIPAAVGRDSVFGVQFHPEKSQQSGLLVLRSFVEEVH